MPQLPLASSVFLHLISYKRALLQLFSVARAKVYLLQPAVEKTCKGISVELFLHGREGGNHKSCEVSSLLHIIP